MEEGDVGLDGRQQDNRVARALERVVSAACSAAWIAGQVASMTRNVPAVTAAAKHGAGPVSPRLTAEVSMTESAPAPISKSACRDEAGRVTR